ncbi:tripartite tricarboxylate transporter substrate binding protein [Bosea sp. TWI1241]|uniref:tripartite tricarboxylate transporter substrate binding protein n=1 Tax=Bosea sp. TWI1241 TaxID=3148904 RepID=UPI00320A65F1
MKLMCKRLAAAAGLGLALISGAACAQGAKAALAKVKPADFPTQPIEMTVVYPAGGGADLTARLLAKTMEDITGNRILVNNRTGGAGMVGHAWLATQAPADGYAIGMLVNLVWGDSMLRAQGRWTHTDLEPVGYLNSDPMMWFVTNDGPFKGKTLKDIVQAAKDKPGTIRVATVPGSMWDYSIEQVEKQNDARFLRVPFQSGGAGVVGLIGNNVDVALGFYAEAKPHMEAGKIRGVGVASPERLSHAKDMPTLNEQLGGKDYLWTLLRFVVVPKKTPADRKAYIGAMVKAAMQQKSLRDEYAKLGVYFDPALENAANITEALNAEAERERAFYVKTGRLKP